MRQTQCRTIRGTDALQDLSYVYDPMGNVTHIEDDAQQTLYFNNQVVTPAADYTYDAVYRLRRAEGREHIGQVSRSETTWNDDGRVGLPSPGDGQAMRRFAEQYGYDAAGNLRELVHTAANGSWTRRFSYDEPSLIEPGTASNRLSSVVVGKGPPERFGYDAHGNMMAMAHLAGMEWDFRDQLRRVDLGGGGTAYYVYDAAGERVRKVVEKNAGNLVEERITVAAFEVFRRRNAAGAVSLERQSLHVMDGGQRIALVDTRTLGIETGVPAQLVRFQLGNHLGSAVLELDGAGQIISYEEYYPYGATSYQAGRNASEVSLKRYRYTGQERDSETGLNHHGKRYYAPWLGRWTSCDPIGVKDGLNVYCSFHCNPLTYTDPSGTGNQRTPKVVGYASTVKEGLTRMKELGVAARKEYGLASDPASGKLLILEGTYLDVPFGKLIPLGHTHTGKDTSSVASTADLNEFARKNVKESWIYGSGEEDGWSRYRYDAKTKSFDVSLFRPSGTRNFKLSLNPKFEPKNMETGGPESKWLTDEQLASRTKSTSPPLPRLPRDPHQGPGRRGRRHRRHCFYRRRSDQGSPRGPSRKGGGHRGRRNRARLCLQAVSAGHGFHRCGRHDHGLRRQGQDAGKCRRRSLGRLSGFQRPHRDRRAERLRLRRGEIHIQRGDQTDRHRYRRGRGGRVHPAHVGRVHVESLQSGVVSLVNRPATNSPAPNTASKSTSHQRQ